MLVILKVGHFYVVLVKLYVQHYLVFNTRLSVSQNFTGPHINDGSICMSEKYSLELDDDLLLQ
jgi:hypothetical protein